MSRSLDDLDPAVQPRFRAFVAELTARGIAFAIIETRRTQLVQLAYWLQGRAELATVNAVRKLSDLYELSAEENKRTITQVSGIISPASHQRGVAADIAPIDPATGKVLWNTAVNKAAWEKIIKVGRYMGFVCGADWPPIDPATGFGWDVPHFEV